MAWAIPAAAYVLVLGVLGVSTKLALRTITWQQMVLWVPIVYGAWALGIALASGARLPFGVGGAWAILSAFCASSALIVFFIALRYGSASTVVPITSAYPALTLLLSALFLAEKITTERIVGTALVVAGVAFLSR